MSRTDFGIAWFGMGIWVGMALMALIIGVVGKAERKAHAQSAERPSISDPQVIRKLDAPAGLGSDSWIYKFQDGPNDCYAINKYGHGVSISCVKR